MAVLAVRKATVRFPCSRAVTDYKEKAFVKKTFSYI